MREMGVTEAFECVPDTLLFFLFFYAVQCFLPTVSFLHAGNQTFIHVFSSATLQLLKVTTTIMRSYTGNYDMWQREMRRIAATVACAMHMNTSLTSY